MTDSQNKTGAHCIPPVHLIEYITISHTICVQLSAVPQDRISAHCFLKDAGKINSISRARGTINMDKYHLSPMQFPFARMLLITSVLVALATCFLLVNLLTSKTRIKCPQAKFPRYITDGSTVELCSRTALKQHSSDGRGWPMPENKQACSRRLDAERTQEHGTARAQPVCIFNQGSLLCTLIDIIMGCVRQGPGGSRPIV